MTVQTEAQRQFYLQVAGISCWYSRTVLTGAAPSPDFDFDEPGPPVPDSVDEPPVDRKASGQGRRQSLAAIQGLVSPSAGRASRAVPEPTPEVAPTVADTAPAADVETPADRPGEAAPTDVEGGAGVSDLAVTGVHWGVWFSDGFVIVSTLSADASARLQDALAENILRAIGQTPKERNSLQWPVFNNPGVPGNDEAGLRVVLRDLAAQFNGRRIITLGLLPGYAEHDRIRWLESVLGNLTVEFPFSLAALSADPDRKRQLWGELRPVLETSV